MGNTQSAEHHHSHHHHHHQHNRLSKPKTHSTVLLSVAPKPGTSTAAASQSNVCLSAKDHPQISSQLPSPVVTDFGCHSHGNDGVGPPAGPPSHRRQSSTSRANSLSCFGSSKSNDTTKLTSLPGSKISLVSNGQVVDLKTAIQIVQDAKQNASPADLAALEKEFRNASISLSRSSLQSDPALSRRRNSTIRNSTSSITRRRSLFATPGVAMRNAPVEGSRRTWHSWKAPKLDPQDEAKWKFAMKVKLPLTQHDLSALDRAEQGRESPPPRAETPGDMDYSHLGSLRLGSLRVTNGAASPAPSGYRKEDYFTPSETDDDSLIMKATRRSRHMRSKSAIQPGTRPLHRKPSMSDRARRAKTMYKFDSPPRRRSPVSIVLDDVEEPEPVRRLRVMNKSVDTLSMADSLAKDYQADIPKSPFEASRLDRQKPKEQALTPNDSQFFRQEAFRLLDGTIFSDSSARDNKSSQSSEVQSNAGLDAASDCSWKQSPRPYPRKADSGYSSGGSFRTVQRHGTGDETDSTLSRNPSATVDARRTASPVSVDSASVYTFDQRMESANGPKSTMDASAERRPSQISPSHLSELVSRGVDVRFVGDSSPVPKTPSTPVSITSKFSVDSKGNPTKKLQKRRPSQQELPVVQSCEPIPETTVPEIPSPVRNTFVRRLSEGVGMGHLTRTYPSTEHVNQVVALPAYAPEERGRQDVQSVTERPASPKPQAKKSFRQSIAIFKNWSSKTAKEPAEGSHENALPHLVDFGTSATSIGSSPYDIATPPVRSKSVTPPTHPHHIGSSLFRTKSSAQMDADTAVQFARMRSRDRAMGRPAMPQRPQSYHHERSHSRKQSFDNCVPSVPSIGRQDPPATAHTPGGAAEPGLPASARSSLGFRPRKTGRGPMVSEIIDKYDRNGELIVRQEQVNWQPHARLQNQRRRSAGEGLRERAREEAREEAQPRTYTMNEKSMPRHVVVDRYYGGYSHGHNGRNHGFGGSVGTRQLHSYNNPKTMRYGNQHGMSMVNVPIFAQQA